MSGVQNGILVTHKFVRCILSREYTEQTTCGTQRSLKHNLDERDWVVTFVQEMERFSSVRNFLNRTAEDV